MKTKIKKIFSLVANLALAVTFVFAVGALSGCDESENENGNLPSLNNYLDEIQSYIITIDPQNDATLKMNYSIEWKVLNDKNEGPLEWVKIGIPNKYVYEITFGGDVKKAEYYSDSGSFMRADLKRKFYAGETAKIEFSFTQKRIFTKTKNEDTIEFGFIPGWFNEIEIKNLKVLWKNDESIVYTNAEKEEDGYLLWEKTNLKAGESIKTAVKYPLSFFKNIDLSQDYSSKTVRFTDMLPFIIGVAIGAGAFVAVLIFSYIHKDGYTSHRGYYGSGYSGGFGYYHVHSPLWYFGRRNKRGVDGKGKSMPYLNDDGSRPSSGSGHSGGGSSCACACACAGGGRAGCSRKDFYNSQTNEFIKAFNEKEKPLRADAKN